MTISAELFSIQTMILEKTLKVSYIDKKGKIATPTALILTDEIRISHFSSPESLAQGELL